MSTGRPVLTCVILTLCPVFHKPLPLPNMSVPPRTHPIPAPLSSVPFKFPNNSCFKILRADSGKRGNINLTLTPSAKVISHLSPTLASCHVTRTCSLSPSSVLALSLPPNRLHYRGHAVRPQPHCSNETNGRTPPHWCNLFWKSNDCMWTDATLKSMNSSWYLPLIQSTGRKKKKKGLSVRFFSHFIRERT